jgi:isoleucyl-tRNA synthetase
MRAIEGVRSTGAIGSSLQAEVDVAADGTLFEDLASLGDDLRFVLITSAARLREAEDGEVGAEDSATGRITVVPSTHAKCGRCWHWRADVGQDPAPPELCGRCTGTLSGAAEPRHAA